ncbi:peptidoglycan DD-metalloendopeptidase family protein [Patescibacteria group bacterium]|nr:peptidoglycan DD-metalloendopeptidase family protein [Patescibacteria group bacterium]
MNILTYLILNPILFASILVPFQAQASIGSFFRGFFAPSQTQAEVTSTNSQTMALLQAAISPDQESSTTSAKDTPIIEGTSLSSETFTLTPPETKTFEDDQISSYVVHEGDTLPAIAKMFNVSVNTIRWGNDIKGNTVTVGQTLVILPVSGIKHVVKSGENLQSIAKLHKGNLDDIMQYNNLSKDAKLAVGDVIVIPDGESIQVTPSTTKIKVNGVGKLSPNIPQYLGYFLRPIIGGIKTQGIHGHNGVDLASAYGSNILAAAEGVVIISKSSGFNGGYGSYVVIKHGNGTQTLYGHLSGTAVSAGDEVTQGQLIGYMGNSGHVTGVTGIHLHFEVRGARNPF